MSAPVTPPNREQPAFPLFDSQGDAYPGEKGLTKAEWFAGHALPVMLRHFMRDFEETRSQRETLKDKRDIDDFIAMAVEDSRRIGVMMSRDLK